LQYAVRKVKIGRYTVRKGGGGHPHLYLFLLTMFGIRAIKIGGLIEQLIIKEVYRLV